MKSLVFGTLCGIKSLHKGNEAYAVSEGILQHLFPILPDVLQGCPLSVTLFAFAIDPLRVSFRRYLIGTTTRSCADDIGMALRRLEVIGLVFKLSKDFRRISFLTFKPAKCVLIKPFCVTSKWKVDMIKAFLRRVVPAWAPIASETWPNTLALLLGVWLEGNNGRELQWKFSRNCIDLKQSEQPFALCIGQFHGRGVPVLDMLPNMLPPLPRLFALSYLLFFRPRVFLVVS